MFDKILAAISFNPAYVPFLFILGLVGFIVVHAHYSSKESFNVFHLLTDSVTERGSLEKVMMLFAGLSITWWFMSSVAVGKATYEDAIAYGGLLGLAKVAKDVINLKSTKPTKEPKSE